MNCCKECAGKSQAALSYYTRRQRVRVRHGTGLRGLGRVRLGSLGYSSTPPANAASYQSACLRPLPPNTYIDAVVQIDASTVDFYYHYIPLPGSSQPAQMWVCRTKVQNPSDPSTWAAAGQTQSPVVNIDPNTYDASPDYSPGTILNPLPAAASIASATSGLASWFSSNWIWLAAIALGAVVLEDAL